MTKYDNNNKTWDNILLWFLDEIKAKKSGIEIEMKEMRRIEKRLYQPTRSSGKIVTGVRPEPPHKTNFIGDRSASRGRFNPLPCF